MVLPGSGCQRRSLPRAGASEAVSARQRDMVCRAAARLDMRVLLLMEGGSWSVVRAGAEAGCVAGSVEQTLTGLQPVRRPWGPGPKAGFVGAWRAGAHARGARGRSRSPGPSMGYVISQSRASTHALLSHRGAGPLRTPLSAAEGTCFGRLRQSAGTDGCGHAGGAFDGVGLCRARDAAGADGQRRRAFRGVRQQRRVPDRAAMAKAGPPAAVNNHPGAVSPREKNAARRPDRIVNNLMRRLKNRTWILQVMREIVTC